jgi:phosphoribosyl 1,2-cyclic phosphodiesterase
MSILASGSAGNSLFVEAGGTRLLVDAGLPARELSRRLAFVPQAPAPERMDALLLTHEHADHAAHAMGLVRRGLEAYATAGTLSALGLPPEGCRPIEAGRLFSVGAIEVTPVPLPHDAADPVAFLLGHEGSRIGIITDCGHPAAEVADAFSGCDVLVLEANHDAHMLRYGSYPPSLKRRIGGTRGHLSNDEAGELLRLMAQRGGLPRCVVLAHLSHLNNRPTLARSAVARVIGRRPVRVVVATQGRALAPITLEGESVTIADGLPGEQLQLPLSAGPGVASAS